MDVRILRPKDNFHFSHNYKRVKIEFNDGSVMVGFINIHAKFLGNEFQQADPDTYRSFDDAKFKFSRVSDYLKECFRKEGMITVFDAVYGDSDAHKVYFVFLTSVKLISEEPEAPKESKNDAST